MKQKEKVKGVFACINVIVVTPIWLYLLYQILMRVNASELMWFLYWVYIPVAAAVSFTMILLEKD